MSLQSCEDGVNLTLTNKEGILCPLEHLLQMGYILSLKVNQDLTLRSRVWIYPLMELNCFQLKKLQRIMKKKPWQQFLSQTKKFQSSSKKSRIIVMQKQVAGSLRTVH